MQGNMCIDDEPVWSHDDPKKISHERFADKVGVPVIRNMTTACHFAQNNVPLTRTFRPFFSSIVSHAIISRLFVIIRLPTAQWVSLPWRKDCTFTLISTYHSSMMVQVVVDERLVCVITLTMRTVSERNHYEERSSR